MFVARSATRSRLRLTRSSSSDGRDRARVVHHVRQQDAEDRIVQRVHLRRRALQTSRPSAPSARMKASSASPSIARARRAMSSISGSGASRRALSSEPQRALRDVHRVIADALEIVRDLDRADDEAKVARHRLLQREQRDRALLDLDLERVELRVAGDHRLRLAGVARRAARRRRDR